MVVPGFGAFLTRSFPAEINPATHMLRPPSKRVVFNARIQENDGLLAQHIARAESSTYRAALESIEVASKGWKKSLRSGRKVNLSGIGRLYMDDKGKLQFNPAHDVNYDVYSYGLNIFRANAMEREQEIKRSVNKAIEKHQATKKGATKVTNKNTPEKAGINWKPWVATLGPVAAILLVGGYFYFQNPGFINELPGKFGNIANLGDSNSDSASQAETNESSIGFSAAERLNKGFGPEDDVISEQNDQGQANVNQEEPLEEEQALEPEVVEEPNTESEANLTESSEPKEKPRKSAAEDLMKVESFDLINKPLYNVKKREADTEGEETQSELPNSWSPELQALSEAEKMGHSKVAAKSVEEKPVNTIKAAPTKVKATPSKAEEKPLVKPLEKNSGADIAASKIQIIVGAFAQLENAQRYVSKLQADGWEAYMYKQGRLNRVAIGAYDSNKDAQALLSKVKQEVNYNAWINIP